MVWRVYSVSTLDWNSKVLVTPTADFSWSRALSGGKGGSCSFKLGDPSVAETANGSTLAPWERMIVAEYQGQIVYAGFITSSDYDRDTQTLTVTHEDLWAVMNRRLMAGLVADGVQTTALVYTGKSSSDLIREAVYEGQNDAARFNLPIALPALTGGGISETYEGYNLPTVSAVLNDLMNTEGGPDIDFFPRWWGDFGSFEWVLRVGDLREGSWEWDVTADQSPASGLRERRDGSLMANRIAAVGEGSEKRMLVKVVDGSAGSSFLPLDASPAYKDEKDEAKLAARARADLAVRSKPTKQISMDVQMDGDFAVHQLRLGGSVRWKTEGDPWFADGWHTSRLVEYSGSLTGKIHLEFQTEG